MEIFRATKATIDKSFVYNGCSLQGMNQKRGFTPLTHRVLMRLIVIIYDFHPIRIMKVPGRALFAADTKFKF